ncbi:MAG: coiled-coil domain-containing protein [Coriobacteriales bacterium]
MSQLKRNLFAAAALSLLLAIAALSPVGGVSLPANADEMSDLQAQVEQSAADYNEAVSRTNELDQQIQDTNSRIADLEAKLPEQRAEAGQIIKNEYVYQTNTSSFLSIILSADSFDDVITTLDYYARIDSHNKQVIDSTVSAKQDLENMQAQLSSDKAEAESEQQKAAVALQAAESSRQLAMQRAAEQAAAEVSSQQQEQQAQAAAPASNNSGQSESISSSVSSDSVDWGTGKSSFVSQWAPRINSYLSGSPLAGYGEQFASAAWDYGVDPRWSPAISMVESSKGAHCFRPHNAWGWGSSGWGSWEEAINAHVAGLARSYGSTLTYAAAQKYCPPNASHW